MACTIYCQHWTEESFTVTTTGGAAPTRAFTAGVAYLSPHEVIAWMNLALSALVEFSLDDEVGLVQVKWNATPGTLAWNNDDLRDYLGFTGDLTHATTVAPNEPLGYWHGGAATPWGQDARQELGDVVSPYGRLKASSESGTYSFGSIRLWIKRRTDGKAFAAALETLYAAADEWAAWPIAISPRTDADFESHVVVEGWECNLASLDEETQTLDLETIRWQAE